MDEILLANFMVFRDVVRAEDYDLWIGDEAWELDYYLHENPSLKTAPYVFLTDFVGWLPMAEGGARGGAADRRLQRRDARAHRRAAGRARPRDLRRLARRTSSRTASATACPRSGRGSRSTSTSAATSSRPTRAAGRPRGAARRARLRPGRARLHRHGRRLGRRRGAARRVVAAYPAARERVPGLRMVAVCGPRIDPDSLGAPDGVEVVALRRPPLAPPRGVRRRGHPGRPDAPAWSSRRRSGRSSTSRCAATSSRTSTSATASSATARGGAMDVATATPDALAAAIGDALAGGSEPGRVERDGAARAAALIADAALTRHPDRHRRTSRHGEPERVRLP